MAVSFCLRKLRFEIGNFAALSLRNGFLAFGVIAGVFRNNVQLVPPLFIFNSAGALVPVPAFVEIPCHDIVAASAGTVVPDEVKKRAVATGSAGNTEDDVRPRSKRK